jgi:hypothetical protein
MSRMLSPDENKIMNATTIPECQTLDVKGTATELGVCEETIRPPRSAKGAAKASWPPARADSAD